MTASLADRVAVALANHNWWASGNLGVPGMPDAITYKCDCGWNGDEPRAHVASAVAAQLATTAPLPQRLREAAETIEQINAMAGMGQNCSVSPLWLRREATVLEQEWLG